MKKVIAIVMTLMLVFSLTGCFSKTDAVLAYYDAHSEELAQQMETAFEGSSGMDCTCEINVVGKGFVFDVNIMDIDELPQEQKDLFQSAFDEMDGTFETMLDEMKVEVPELEGFTFNINDKDGDNIAVIKAGD